MFFNKQFRKVEIVFRIILIIFVVKNIIKLKYIVTLLVILFNFTTNIV